MGIESVTFYFFKFLGKSARNPFYQKGVSRIIKQILLTRILVAEDEGLAVGALNHSGILLVRTDADSLKGAVVALAGVVCTLGNCALDHVVLVCLIHF